MDIMATDEGFYTQVFQRHAHPVSAWSRLLTTPLLLVPAVDSAVVAARAHRRLVVVNLIARPRARDLRRLRHRPSWVRSRGAGSHARAGGAGRDFLAGTRS